MTEQHPGWRKGRLSIWRRGVAVTALAVLAVGLGWPLISQLIHPPDPRDQPEDVTAEATAEVAPTPVNQGTRLEWAPGIQTWRHWYVGGSDEHLANLHRQGFGWVKQRFAWADLQPLEGSEISFSQPDMFLHGVEAAGPGFKVLIQLDVPPEWATPGEDFYLIDWYGFVNGFADKFAGRVHAYEIGNEPNLANPWSNEPNPEEYAGVLQTAYEAIKDADPNALVVSAGLSPTGGDTPDAMDDEEYLRALYAAMEPVVRQPTKGGADAAPLEDSNLELEEISSRSPSEGFFDALGVHAPGFRAAPEVAPEEAAADAQLGGQRFFTFRRIEDLRQVMEEAGDGHKRVVITEFGWTTDQRPDSPYTWSAVSRAERVDYTRRAFQYAADNWADWVGPLFLFTAPDPSWTSEHEAYWRAVTDNEGRLLDGLSLDGLGVVARPPVGVPADVEAERAIRTEERIPPLPLAAADLPVLGSGFSQPPTVHHLGGAITAAARDGNRLALAEGRYVALMDVSDPTNPVELARSTAFDNLVGSVAIDGDLIAAGFPERGDAPTRITLLAVEGAALEASREVVLSPVPANTTLFGQPRLHLAADELLTAQAYCHSQEVGDHWQSDCSFVVNRITGLPGTVTVEEVLRAPMQSPTLGSQPAFGTGALYVPGGAGVVAYVLGTQGYQAVGEVDLGPLAGGIAWMSVADNVLAVLGECGGVTQADNRMCPTTLYVVDANEPASLVLMKSLAVDGNEGFRDHGFVGVIQPRCNFGACQRIATLIDLNEGTPRTVGRLALAASDSTADALLPVAVVGDQVLTADALGLSARTFDALGNATQATRAKSGRPYRVDSVVRLASDRPAMLAGNRLAVMDSVDGLVTASMPMPACGQGETPVPMDLAPLGSLAVVVMSGGGLVVADTDRTDPHQIGCAEMTDVSSRFVATEGSFAYVAGSDRPGHQGVSLTVVDVSTPTKPEVMGTVWAEVPPATDSVGGDSEVADVTVAGGRAYLAMGGSSGSVILVFDVGDAQAPRLVGRLSSPATAVLAGNDRLFAAVSCPLGSAAYANPDPCAGGLRIYDTSGSGLPRELGNIGTTFEFQSLAMADEGLWAAGGGGVWLLDVEDSTQPRIVDGTGPGSRTGWDRVGSQYLFSFPSTSSSLAVIGSTLFAAEGWAGLMVLSTDGAME